jgi:hypothetical protein
MQIMSNTKGKITRSINSLKTKLLLRDVYLSRGKTRNIMKFLKPWFWHYSTSTAITVAIRFKNENNAHTHNVKVNTLTRSPKNIFRQFFFENNSFQCGISDTDTQTCAQTHTRTLTLTHKTHMYPYIYVYIYNYIVYKVTVQYSFPPLSSTFE